MIKNKKRLILIVIGIILLLLIDQLSKIFIIGKNIVIIPNCIELNFNEVVDGSFGVGFKGTFTFILTNIIVLGVLIKFMKMQQEQIDNKTYFALIMIIAGAIGNLLDRIFRGYVVKFINLGDFPAINISDIFIFVGWILLATFFVIFALKVKKQNNK